MDWHESDQSEEEIHANNRKRSSRACDQCRKTKSKCERSANENLPCKSCAVAGATCTFLGPSYKRGPPKGYIHAIEQRWHQVEALLGAIIDCPDMRVQRLVDELKQDDLAADIINRVDMGPYGPSGRRSQSVGVTKEEFFASVLRSNGASRANDPSRSRRQSRVSREIVSSTQDNGLSVVPTREWQDSLSARLASAGAQTSGYGCIVEPANTTAQTKKLDVYREGSAVSTEGSTQPDWNDEYTLEDAGDTDEGPEAAAESMGQLTLDEHRDVRYHGRASGLHFLSRSIKTDEGVWRLPMTRVWPPANYTRIHEEDCESMLPPPHVQDQLLDIYLTYTHPLFPVIHKTRFLAEYNARKHKKVPFNTSTSKLEPSQEVTPLLLLSMFAISSRFSDEALSCDDETHDPSYEYLQSALAILTKNFHRSRPSTVQALLLLGYREFGAGMGHPSLIFAVLHVIPGSTEQGWLFIGMAIRMAFDLGMHCDSTNWKINGRDLFTREELQTRRQIWWSCYLIDRYSSAYIGRPPMIRDDDHDTPMTECGFEEENRMWKPIPSRLINITYSPVPGRILSCFCAAARLAILVGEILTRLYPVRMSPNVSKRAILAELESRLDRWYITLPDTLRYWGGVLLLNRALIPNWKGNKLSPKSSAMELKAFDLAQGAASHVSAIVTAYKENFTLKRSAPFIPGYILSAAIMHILTLTFRPSNVEASLGLEQCMSALEEIKGTWASATRAWNLLSSQLGAEHKHLLHLQGTERHKRSADDAFGSEKSSAYLQREVFGSVQPEFATGSENGVQELSSRIMAHMLGLDIPGVEPSTSYYPGNEWWPSTNQMLPQQQLPSPIEQPAIQSRGDPPPVPTPVELRTQADAGWLREAVPNNSASTNSAMNFSYNFGRFGT